MYFVLMPAVSSRLGREASLLSEFPDVSKGMWWSLKMEALRSVKMSGTTKLATQRFVPEGPKSLIFWRRNYFF